jgi:hypothetical protein
VFLRPKIFTSRMRTYLLLRPSRCVRFVFLRPITNSVRERDHPGGTLKHLIHIPPSKAF